MYCRISVEGLYSCLNVLKSLMFGAFSRRQESIFEFIFENDKRSDEVWEYSPEHVQNASSSLDLLRKYIQNRLGVFYIGSKP